VTGSHYGPAVHTSSPVPWPRVAAVIAGILGVAVLWLAWTWWSTHRALDQQQVEGISQRDDAGGEADGGDGLGGVLNVLLVGSDDRSDLSEEERRRLHTGTFDGARTDTILWVQLREDGVSLLSFPRDLRVIGPDGDGHRINRILELGGADALVGVVEAILGADLDHYVEVSISSFLDIVDAAGGVELCLDEPLVDRKSGADFEAGCHRMDGVDALAYVRSRRGERADFARVERQQRFLSALAGRATSLGVLGNPVRLRAVATTVADGLTVDDQLSVARMLEIGNALREVLGAEGLDAYTLPAYPAAIGGVEYVVPYDPGVSEIADRLRNGEPLPPRPSMERREELTVLLRSSGSRDEAVAVESVLFYAGYEPEPDGGAGDLQRLRTTVYADGADEEAAAIAAVLGAEVGMLADDVELDDDTVLVVTGQQVGNG
jgi:LCP family protein required for cell wall assembly